ncbi:MAG: helix-turn-helix transcriptional regulator [Acidiferrobacter sp.]
MEKSLASLRGAFIRYHREKISPAETGLTAQGRRRTPGLRREELAQLCGVSTTWITWLEQGRPVSASAMVLCKISDALQLSRAERAYLFDLAGRRDPDGPDTLPVPAHPVLALVDYIDAPAYVLDRYWNVVATNASAAAVFGAALSPPAAGAPPPNLLRFVFQDPAAARLIDRWAERAGRLVAEFRADTGRFWQDPVWIALIEDLCASSPPFSAYWDRQDVQDREGGQRRFHHPLRGDLVFEQLTLKPATSVDLKLVVLLPSV